MTQVYQDKLTPPSWDWVLGLLHRGSHRWSQQSRVLKALEQCAQFQDVVLRNQQNGLDVQRVARVTSNDEVRNRAADLVLMGLQMLHDYSDNDRQILDALQHKFDRLEIKLDGQVAPVDDEEAQLAGFTHI